MIIPIEHSGSVEMLSPPSLSSVNITIASGESHNRTSGRLSLSTGSSVDDSGNISLRVGNSSNTNGGMIHLESGSSSRKSGHGGHVKVSAGSSEKYSDGKGGNISIHGGHSLGITKGETHSQHGGSIALIGGDATHGLGFRLGKWRFICVHWFSQI